MSSKMPPRRPVVLLIMDGIGLNPSTENNALAQANTPRLDELFKNQPNVAIDPKGGAVGLPEGQMGNSEVGHLTIGAGTIDKQSLVRIDDAIEDGSIRTNEALVTAMQRAKAANLPIHLVGMISDGGVHSHISHAIALVQLAGEIGVRPLLHMITDGRDTAPRCAKQYLPPLEAALNEARGCIATLSGRYWAMDRDTRWDRTEKAWRAMALNQGESCGSAAEAIDKGYAAEKGDEFIEPSVLPGAEPINAGSEVIFFNFRNDRPRQLTEALAFESFAHFERPGFAPVTVTTMTQYDANYGLPIAFPPRPLGVTLGEVVSQAGIRQFRCSETEKYAHVTFFFNGGREEPFAGEERKLIPSPKVATYDLAPEMSAQGIADAVIEALGSESYGLVILNFANGDMVGHTAVREAVIRAVEVLDTQVGRVVDAAQAKGYSVIITADHGNAEEMADSGANPNTQHSLFPVPFILIDQDSWTLKQDGGLSNIAPTVLKLMGLPIPDSMDAEPMIS